MTVRWLLKAREMQPHHTSEEPRTIICTGEVMESLIVKLYPVVRATDFEPRHNQDRLSNKFRCFSNFTCQDWSWLE